MAVFVYSKEDGVPIQDQERLLDDMKESVGTNYSPEVADEVVMTARQEVERLVGEVMAPYWATEFETEKDLVVAAKRQKTILNSDLDSGKYQRGEIISATEQRAIELGVQDANVLRNVRFLFSQFLARVIHRTMENINVDAGAFRNKRPDPEDRRDPDMGVFSHEGGEEEYNGGF
jgi:hypothetical protein